MLYNTKNVFFCTSGSENLYLYMLARMLGSKESQSPLFLYFAQPRQCVCACWLCYTRRFYTFLLGKESTRNIYVLYMGINLNHHTQRARVDIIYVQKSGYRSHKSYTFGVNKFAIYVCFYFVANFFFLNNQLFQGKERKTKFVLYLHWESIIECDRVFSFHCKTWI